MGGGLSLQQGELVSKAELRGHTDAVRGVACFTLADGITQLVALVPSHAARCRFLAATCACVQRRATRGCRARACHFSGL